MPDENDIVYNSYGLDLVGMLRALIEWVISLFTSGDASRSAQEFIEFLGIFWNIYSIIAILFSIIFFAGFIYAKIRIEQLSGIITDQLLHTEAEWARVYGNTSSAVHNRWEEVKTHVASDVPTNWRLAIIEADILLDEALTQTGHVGSSVGEKLKSSNSQAFQSLQDAWDAHLVRNQIAHEGSDFVLTKRTADEAVVKFERALRELGAL